MSLPYLAQAADHQRIEWLHGSTMQILLGGDNTDEQLAVVRTTLPSGVAAPVHVHANEDEVFVLLRGSGVFWAGEQRFELEEGGVVYLPRNLPHAYHFTGESNDLLTICTPAGIERFFRAAGWDVTQPKPEGWSMTPAAMAAAGVAHGQTILGPPLGPADRIPEALLARSIG